MWSAAKKTFEEVKQMLDTFPYNTLEKNKGITIIHEEDHMSIGVSYEDGYEDEHDENGIYIFNLFWHNEYVNIGGVGNNDEIINEIVNTWNQFMLI